VPVVYEWLSERSTGAGPDLSGGCLKMTDKVDNLRANQRRAIEALLSGSTKQAAAGAAGVTPRTISRWLDQPEFIEALNRRVDQAVTDATRRMAGSLDGAITVMQDVMTDAEAPASVRLRAAQAFTDIMIRLAAMKSGYASNMGPHQIIVRYEDEMDDQPIKLSWGDD